MKYASLISLVALALVVSAVAVADEQIDNEQYAKWSGFKAGYFVLLKITTKAGEIECEQTIKMTLKELTDEKAVVTTESVMYVDGKAMEPTVFEREIPARIDKPEEDEDSAAKEIGKGEEKITVKGEEFDTKWVKSETETEGVKTTITVWSCEEMPGGVVKMVATGEGYGMTSESTTIVTDYKADKKE